MDYLWLKALHVAAVLVWIGGLLVVAVAIAALSLSKEAAERPDRTAVFCSYGGRGSRSPCSADGSVRPG